MNWQQLVFGFLLMSVGLIALTAGPVMRAVAAEEACRAIVEAGLVRSCTMR